MSKIDMRGICSGRYRIRQKKLKSRIIQLTKNGYKISIPKEMGIQKGEIYLFERIDENNIKMVKVSQ